MPLKILKAADAIAYALTFTIMAWMWTVHVGSVFAYPYFTPSSNVEELAYTYISSANYNRFGFPFCGFLRNFAASHDPADHPYVYSHMPPGPDIVNALSMRATGGRSGFADCAPWGTIGTIVQEARGGENCALLTIYELRQRR